MEQRHVFNEAKYKVLHLLETEKRYLSVEQISEMVGISKGAISNQLHRLHKWGYVWRLNNPCCINRKSHYLYGFLKPKGRRVYDRYHEYKKITEVTGINIPLVWYTVEPLEIIKAKEKYKEIMNIK